jgi:hypothetical protein
VIEEAIFTLITGNAAVKALIGLRLYPGVIPQTADLPAVAYRVGDTQQSYTHDGPSKIATHGVFFVIDAKTLNEAKSVDAAIKKVLSGFRGEVVTTKIGGIFFRNGDWFYNPVSEIFVVSQDYQIVWKEV